jgi:hypothetical protein
VLAPALALGVLVARRRARAAGQVRTDAIAVAIGIAGSGAAGAVLPESLSLVGAAAIALGLVAAVALRPLRGGLIPSVLAAAMVGLPLGALGRSVATELGPVAALSAILAIVALALATAIATLTAHLSRSRARVVTATVLAFAIAGCVGRAAWVLAPTLPSRVMSVPTIEALGVYPTFYALAAAVACALVTFAAVVRTGFDDPPDR